MRLGSRPARVPVSRDPVRSDRDVPLADHLPDLPREPLIFRHRTGVWDLTWRPRVVGILNLTPDSFYDGGRYATSDAAMARAEVMVSEGADAIDVGGQSTRPGAKPLSAEEEWARLGPFLGSLVKRIPLPFSIDTYHPEVARRALDAGVAMVNDVTGLGDPSLADAVAGAEAGLVLMHSLGGPGQFHQRRVYHDLAAEMRAFLVERMGLAESRGVPREQIALDPGIGFSKNADQSLGAIHAIPTLKTLGRPIHLGVSRKSFLAKTIGSPEADRLDAALGISMAAYEHGARIYRTHDVRETVETVRLAQMRFAPCESWAPENAPGARR